MTARSYNDWVNDDGLRIRFGRGLAQVTRGGEFSDADGGRTLVEVDVVGTDLKAFNDATDPTTILDWNTRIPPGAYLEAAELDVQVAFAGATATLTLGLVKASDQVAAFTDLDADGIDATIAVTAIAAAGDTITCDGALIGTVLGTDSGGYLVSAEAGTANFTAGKAKLRIWYRMPLDSSLT